MREIHVGKENVNHVRNIQSNKNEFLLKTLNNAMFKAREDSFESSEK